MAMDGLYISGYFSDDDKLMLDNYADELHSKNVPFYVRNLSDTIMQSAFDFADFELIAVAYEVLQQFILNGGYDVTKYFFKKLWWNITKNRESNIPFTISIEGIPTANGYCLTSRVPFRSIFLCGKIRSGLNPLVFAHTKSIFERRWDQ